MPQVTIYIDAETDEAMREAAARAGQSVSAWVGSLIREKSAAEWPAGFFEDLAAAWNDTDPKEFEIEYPPDLPREKW